MCAIVKKPETDTALQFMLTPEHFNNIKVARELLTPCLLCVKTALTNMDCDSAEFGNPVIDNGGTAVLPSRVINNRPRKTGWKLMGRVSGSRVSIFVFR